MDSETLTALLGSIAKWEAIVDGTGQDRGTENCPLCQKFYANLCVGCPVYEKTKKFGCAKTPYVHWAHIYYDDIVSRTQTKPLLVHLAQAEVDFLRSLLPDDKPCPDCGAWSCKPGCPSRLP